MPQARRSPPPGSVPIEEDGVPEVEREPRSPKLRKLENRIQSIYVMIGGALMVLPAQMAGERVKLIGRSLSVHSENIAESWVNLCEEDKRVQRAWESLTGFSAWGEVVGRHLEAIGDETPAVQGVRQERQQQQQPPREEGNDLAAMNAIAEFFSQRQAAMRQEATQTPPPNGPEQGPPPEVVRRMMQEEQRRQQRPVRQQQQQPIQQQPPPMGQTRGRNVGMPTPADLGVVVADVPEDFPSPGEADVKG